MTHRSRPRLVLQILLLSAFVVVAATQYELVLSGVDALRRADHALVLLAFGVFSISIIPCALSYQALSLKPLRVGITLLVQVAAGFANTLLPAGLGGLGLYAAYLHAQGHTAAQSAAIVAANNVIGFAGSILMVAGVLVLHPSYVRELTVPRVSSTRIALIAILIVLGCLALFIFLRIRHGAKLRRYAADQIKALRRSLQPNRRTLYSLLSNMALTLLKSLVLMIVVSSVGASVDWAAALLILSIGTLVGASVPTPGGLGGVEAGLLAGLIAFGAAPTLALAAVLLYRLLTYIVPIVPGIIAFRYVQPYLPTAR